MSSTRAGFAESFAWIYKYDLNLLKKFLGVHAAIGEF